MPTRNGAGADSLRSEIKPYTKEELASELKQYPSETAESLQEMRARSIRRAADDKASDKRIKNEVPTGEDFRRAGKSFFTRSGYAFEELKAGTLIQMKDGDIFKVTQAVGPREDKSGEEGWDGSDSVVYVQDIKGREGRIDDLTAIENYIPVGKGYEKKSLRDDKPKDALTDIKAEIKEALKGGKFDFGQVTKRSRLIPKLESIMRGFTREKKNDEAVFISDQIARLRKKQG